MYAGHDQLLGGASPLWRLMAPTTSRGQLRRCEAGWEGSRRRSRDPRDTNRIRGGAAWASQQCVAKPDVIKGPSCKCGGCARRVAGLLPGDLRGCRSMPGRCFGVGRRVGATVVAGRLLLAVEKSAEVVVPAGSVVAGKGRTRSRASGRSCSWSFALTAANPCVGGLGGPEGDARWCPSRAQQRSGAG
jgi:hypothetical protein